MFSGYSLRNVRIISQNLIIIYKISVIFSSILVIINKKKIDYMMVSRSLMERLR